MKQEEIMARIVYAGIFDADAGAVDAALMRAFASSLTHIIVNAAEPRPFLMVEEKILQIHAQEIVEALQIVLRIFTAQHTPPDIIVCSNSFRSRSAVKNIARKMLGAEQSFKAVSVSLCMEYMDDMLDMRPSDFVFHKLFFEKKRHSNDQLVIRDNTLIIRPSALLAIYEAVFFKKPFIDKYMQVILNAKDTFVVRAPIGLPLFYFITQFTSIIPAQAEHFFMEDFVRREILFDFSTPVSKHFSHIFILTDKDFSVLYNTVGKYGEAALKHSNTRSG